MTTDADIGLGTTFEMADIATPTVFTAIAEIFNMEPPTAEDETVEATHYGSPDNSREYIPGLSDMGSMTFEMNLVPGSASDLALQAARGVKKVCKITFPNGVTLTFTGVREAYERSIPVDDRMTASVTFKVSGNPAQGVAAAPVNSVLPSISGLPQVGVVLTAYAGSWSGAPAFTYQWKSEGVNIGVATSQTYTPVVGDIGDNLTVAVTGTNTQGAATATSAETIPVIAA